MNSGLPKPPQSTSPTGARIRGSDLALVILLGFFVFWIVQGVIREFAAGIETPSARLNYLIAFYASWVLTWLGAIWFVFVKRRGMSFADLGYVVPSPTWARRGVMFGFAALPVAFVLYLVLRPLLGVQSSTNLSEYFGGDNLTIFHAATILLYAGFLVPIAEELLFRGLLFRWLRQRLEFWPAALISAVVFGIAHQRLDQVVIVTLLGIPLAWLCERSRSLAPAILMHQCYNSLTLMVTFAAVWFGPEPQG